MPHLDSIPADMLERLDRAVPLFTEAAIRGERWSAVLPFSCGLLILAGFSFAAWKAEDGGAGRWCLALAGLVLALAYLPSVVAPEAVLARELLLGLR